MHTQNFVLKSIDPKNIPDEMVDWFADEQIMLHMNDTTDLSKLQLANMFSTFNNKNRIALLAFSKSDGSLVGLFRIYIDLRNSKAETSVLIGNKTYWGKSAVIEIRSRIMRFLFTGLKLNKICGTVRARNFPALFNYTKQGFVKEGVFKQQVLGRQGTYEDVVVFGMLREAWLKNHADPSANTTMEASEKHS